jgi:hypothetical protein
MTQSTDRLSRYLEHLRARVRASGNPELKESAVLPPEISTFCASHPRDCLQLIIDALEHVDSPHLVHAIGDQLLENLLNANAAELQVEVTGQLTTSRKFRQAFACGTHTSVDPAIISEWVNTLRDIGTSKKAERKSLWSKANRQT